MVKIRTVFETNSSSAHGGFVRNSDDWFEDHTLKDDYQLEGFGVIEGEKENILRIGNSYSSLDLNFEWNYGLLAHPVQKIAYAIASYLGGKMDDTGTGEHLHSSAKAKWNDILAAVHSYWPQIDTIQIPRGQYWGGTEMQVDKYLLSDGEFAYFETFDRKYREIGSPAFSHMGALSPKIVERVEENLPGYSYGSIDHESMGMLQGFLNQYNITLVDLFFNRKYVLYTDNDNTPIISELVNLGIISLNPNSLSSIY